MKDGRNPLEVYKRGKKIAFVNEEFNRDLSPWEKQNVGVFNCSNR